MTASEKAFSECREKFLEYTGERPIFKEMEALCFGWDAACEWMQSRNCGNCINYKGEYCEMEVRVSKYPLDKPFCCSLWKDKE